MNNIQNETVPLDMCIGCGACAVACPGDCITMEYSDYGEYIPSIHSDICVGCGACVKVCPNSVLNMEKENDIYGSSDCPEMVGAENACYYHAKVKDIENLLGSTSGGIVSEIIKELFEKQEIDAVVHVCRGSASKGSPHYHAVVSRNFSEADVRRGTVYGAVHFDEVIRQFENKSERILMIGTPCVIKAYKEIFKKNKKYMQNSFISCALICSHNVNDKFTEMMADYYNIEDGQPYICDFRAKDREMADSNNYYTVYKNEEHVLAKENRFDNPWTVLWRNYYFSMNCCVECRDFWGREADFSVKDAWGAPGKNEKYGSSIVIIRNKRINEIFDALRSVKKRTLDIYDVISSQWDTVCLKQKKGGRFIKQIGQYKKNLDESKNVYQADGADGIIKMLRKEKSIKKNTPGNDLKKQGNRVKKIIMFGGFAGDNVGDEAQIHETYNFLKNRYPDCEIKVLSHVMEHTRAVLKCPVGENSRMAIWNMGLPGDIYKDSTEEERQHFIDRGNLVVDNARRVMENLDTVGLSARQSAFLHEIYTSDLVYISGGGYLTGRTLSRLWDHLFVMKIANIFGVPYVLTGHNIGLWDSEYTRKFAAEQLNKAKVITLRDAGISRNELKEIGVAGDFIYETKDDALFCGKEHDILPVLRHMGISPGRYIVVNTHFWGADTAEQKKELIEKQYQIILYLLKNEPEDMDILLLPMTSSDQLPQRILADRLRDRKRVKIINSFGVKSYGFRRVRAIISESKFVVTMKHHPIVFAFGETVPVISLCYSDYYFAKNKGAMALFNKEKYAFKLEDERYMEMFSGLYMSLVNGREDYEKDLQRKLQEIKKQGDKIFNVIDRILL